VIAAFFSAIRWIRVAQGRAFSDERNVRVILKE